MKMVHGKVKYAPGLLFVLLAMVVFAPSALAQPCPASPITLSSQAEIDSFQATYGPCSSLTEDLTISGNDINNLNGLSGLLAAQIPADILIADNPALTQLDGLSGLTSVYWLEIRFNATLADIDGLSILPELRITKKNR